MFLSLKIINAKNLNMYQAITINYIIAFLLTALSYGEPFSVAVAAMTKPLFFSSLWVGFLFIFSFIIMSFSTIKAGIGITTALNKMAVVIPVLVGIFYLNQNDSLLFKLTGILLALISFFLILFKGKNERVSLKALYLPLSVFIVSGLIDTSMEVVNKKFININSPQEIFLMGIFATASLIGVITIIIDLSKNQPQSKLSFKPIIWGSVMGIFNFLVSKMILVNVGLMGGSVVFPVHNAAVVMLTALSGVLFFKEKFTNRQWVGVAIAIVSVILIASAI
jgi:drug/metabolite transporter (DMT)-like permease